MVGIHGYSCIPRMIIICHSLWFYVLLIYFINIQWDASQMTLPPSLRTGVVRGASVDLL